jgi:hypothetical protein
MAFLGLNALQLWCLLHEFATNRYDDAGSPEMALYMHCIGQSLFSGSEKLTLAVQKSADLEEAAPSDLASDKVGKVLSGSKH